MLEILSRSGVVRLEDCLGLLDRIQRCAEPRQAPASLLVSGGLRPSEVLRRYFFCCGFRTVGAQIFVYVPCNSRAWRGRRISGERRLDDQIERSGAIEVNSHLSPTPRYSLCCTFDGEEEVVKRDELVVTAFDDFRRLSYADFDEQARLLDRFSDVIFEAKGLIMLADRLPSADAGSVRSDHDLGDLELSRSVTKNLGRWIDEHHLTLTLQVPDR